MCVPLQSVLTSSSASVLVESWEGRNAFARQGFADESSGPSKSSSDCVLAPCLNMIKGIV